MTAFSEAMIRSLPKVELHCHIEGTMRASTLVELARSSGVELPVDDPTELYRYRNLTEFLDVFWLVQSVLNGRDAWSRLAFESIVDGAEHGLVYRETFFTPGRHLVAGQSLADIVAGLDEGLSAAERQTGATARLIFDIDRDFGPEVAAAHVRELVELRRTDAPGVERVIGIGMDSTELGVDPASFQEAYSTARAAGLRLTAHQGENSPAAAAATAVDRLGAERLDHGISVIDDDDLVKRLAERRLPFTVCPNANVRINPDKFGDIAQHPFRKMREAGLLVTLNTDDPALVGLDLTQEYVLSAAAFDLGWDDLVAIACDAVEASWMDPSEKAATEQLIRSRAPLE